MRRKIERQRDERARLKESSVRETGRKIERGDGVSEKEKDLGRG